MPVWTCVLKLDNRRNITEGTLRALADAVHRGSDIRSYTTFDYAEHMGVPNSREGLIEEMMAYTTVYALGDTHVAAIQTTRYPANCSLGFLPVPSLSFFLNNDTGHNGIARPFLDGTPRPVKPTTDHSGKYTVIDQHDADSPAPSENFTYDFNEYAWHVDDNWHELLSHDVNGTPTRGSLADLANAFRTGRRIKVAVNNLCADLTDTNDPPIEHSVFVELHSMYNHRDTGFLGGESHPLVRVAPTIPLVYRSGRWNYGWILPRTDGMVSQAIINPHTHEFTYTQNHFAMRWFAQ